MMDFCRKCLKAIKLFVLYWTRIVFVKNHFDVPFWTKARANLCGGFLADQYVLYDLKHNDKAEYLSEFDWYRSRYINEPFDFAFNNKVVCAEILKQYVRTPKNYFIKNKGILYDFQSGVKNYEDVTDLLMKADKLIMKPFALGKGNGVHLLAKQGGGFLLDEKPCTRRELAGFLEKEQDYFICEYIKQHPYAETLYEKTVNTIRLITIRDTSTHRFKILFAVQRIGRETSIPVDNGSKGGLIAEIDLDTGRLSYARCLHDLEVYIHHPDSGAMIEGAEIPGWENLKEEILCVSGRIPFMDMVAWDVVITAEGFCVIEANASSGVNILQLWGGQRQGELGDFFKEHGVIKQQGQSRSLDCGR